MGMVANRIEKSVTRIASIVRDEESRKVIRPNEKVQNLYSGMRKRMSYFGSTFFLFIFVVC